MRNFNRLIYGAGAYTLGMPLYAHANFYYNSYLREDQQNQSNEARLKAQYNQSGRKWAIVTGGSEGIGRCYALDLAKSGFNILLASRS